MAKSSKPHSNLFGKSVDEFAKIQEEIFNNLNPVGAIEEIYSEEVAVNTFEIRVIRRLKIATVTSARLEALRQLLEQLLSREDFDGDHLAYQRAAEDLARKWFSNRKTRAFVAKLLRKYDLDDSAIDAAAMRLCGEDLERLDRRLTVAEIRRDKALRFIYEYRQSIGRNFRQTGPCLEHDGIPQLIERVPRGSEWQQSAK
jgi:hypothetical protein